MQSVELIELKMTLEFGIAPVGDILPIATNEQDDQPRVLVSHVANHFRMYLREDVPQMAHEQIRSLGAARCYDDEEVVRAILAHQMPIQHVRRICWYVAARRPSPAEYVDVRRVDDRYVIICDGREVAWAETDWENGEAAEVSIETHPDYRRRGFARQVTAAWIAAALDASKVGFYSHRLTNDASRAVASSLGLVHLSDEVEYI